MSAPARPSTFLKPPVARPEKRDACTASSQIRGIPGSGSRNPKLKLKIEKPPISNRPFGETLSRHAQKTNKVTSRNEKPPHNPDKVLSGRVKKYNDVKLRTLSDLISKLDRALQKEAKPDFRLEDRVELMSTHPFFTPRLDSIYPLLASKINAGNFDGNLSELERIIISKRPDLVTFHYSSIPWIVASPVIAARTGPPSDDPEDFTLGFLERIDAQHFSDSHCPELPAKLRLPLQLKVLAGPKIGDTVDYNPPAADANDIEFACRPKLPEQLEQACQIGPSKEQSTTHQTKSKSKAQPAADSETTQQPRFQPRLSTQRSANPPPATQTTKMSSALGLPLPSTGHRLSPASSSSSDTSLPYDLPLPPRSKPRPKPSEKSMPSRPQSQRPHRPDLPPTSSPMRHIPLNRRPPEYWAKFGHEYTNITGNGPMSEVLEGKRRVPGGHPCLESMEMLDASVLFGIEGRREFGGGWIPGWVNRVVEREVGDGWVERDEKVCGVGEGGLMGLEEVGGWMNELERDTVVVKTRGGSGNDKDAEGEEKENKKQREAGKGVDGEETGDDSFESGGSDEVVLL
ncbi:MAG: hypothetical protein MMC23_005141 [Stictis urceolatum]|nr:hypothetical protein [Stictis urceolata]